MVSADDQSITFNSNQGICKDLLFTLISICAAFVFLPGLSFRDTITYHYFIDRQQEPPLQAGPILSRAPRSRPYLKFALLPLLENQDWAPTPFQPQ